MKRLACVFLLTSLAMWTGCGDDDGTNPPPVTLERVTAAHPGSSPSLTNPNDAVWTGVSSNGIAISYQNLLKPAVAKPTALPDSIFVKAVVRNDTLFLRAVWQDASHDIWRDHYEVVSTAPLNFTRDCCADAAVEREDQLFAMFAGLSNGGYDTWNWRSLTTGPGMLAEGFTFIGDSLAQDNTSLSAKPAVSHSPLGGTTSQPSYMSPDSSEADDYVLHIADVVPFRLTSGWTEGQRIPGWLIDTSVFSRNSSIRGSRWDIRAAGTYDNASTEYRVMMCRPLNTGFTDDLNMAVLDSVRMKLVVLNNQIDIRTGSNSRGITKEFWLIF